MIKHLKALGIFLTTIAILSLVFAMLLWITGTRKILFEHVIHVAGGTLLGIMIVFFLTYATMSILDIYWPPKGEIHVTRGTIIAMLKTIERGWFRMVGDDGKVMTWDKYQVGRSKSETAIFRALKREGFLKVVTEPDMEGNINTYYVVAKEKK